jgi:hypothetical protein
VSNSRVKPTIVSGRNAVVFHLFDSNVATGREHVVMFGDLFQARAFAEVGNFFVCVFVLIPHMNSSAYRCHGTIREGPEDSVRHVTAACGRRSRNFVGPVADSDGPSVSFLFRFGHEPDAVRYLSVKKELAGQHDHTVDKIRFDDRLVNLAFAIWITARRTIGQQQGHRALGCKAAHLHRL